MVGVTAAAIDVALLVVARVSFQWLFVLSNVGRILGGLAAGAAVLRYRPGRND
jgi:hypothetical protein